MRLLGYSTLGLVTLFATTLTGCGDDEDNNGAGAATGGAGGSAASGGSGGATGGAGAAGGSGGATAGAGGVAGSGATAGVGGAAGGTAGAGGASPQSFRVRIENTSGEPMGTPFAPGLWAVHDSSASIFDADATDRGDGLEALAEDGDPSGLAGALTGVSSSGVFDTPMGATAAGPALPGGAYEFTVTATPDAGLLSFATMFVQSNDLFLAPAPAGIALFDSSGAPVSGDVSDQVQLWDSGTERNQAPGFGPMQAPRQPGANAGPTEGRVSRFVDGTRAMPLPEKLVDVTVTESGGTFTVVVENVSGVQGTLVTPIAPVLWASHDTSWSFFTPGSAASAGVEQLAEDGSPASAVPAAAGDPGVASAAAADTPVGEGAPGPAMPGMSYSFDVTPSAAAPLLTLAAMVVQSNDAFLATPSGGVMLMDGANPRSAADVEAEIEARLAVWDAGTEANEVPGVGVNQAPRQAAANTGPVDSDATVRRYDDVTNDLDGPGAGAVAGVTVTNTGGMAFEVVVANQSGPTAYPGPLTPVVWAAHAGGAVLFEMGMPASAELERLAEEGNGGPLATLLTSTTGVGSSGMVNMPEGGTGPGPILPGENYRFSVTADAINRHLSFAFMVAQSNDTFLALEPGGVELVDDQGVVRSDGDIATDIAARLRAWDAGTEANQAGAAGADQAPRQGPNPDVGAAEGNGLVRLVDDSVWAYPAAAQTIRVTITPE